jgi:hypothetical protein
MSFDISILILKRARPSRRAIRVSPFPESDPSLIWCAESERCPTWGVHVGHLKHGNANAKNDDRTFAARCRPSGFGAD